jgi:signal-induced proliferation-associated 1 like protein 3
MLVEPVPVEPVPVEVELPEPEEDPPAAPGVALPPGQTTPGLLSGSWLVVPLLPELSVLWLPSPEGFGVTQMPPVPEPSVPEPLVPVPEPVSVPEPEPEPLVPVPEPLVPVPEPLVSVPEPPVPVPDPLSPGAVLSWPLLVVLVLSVGLVVVPGSVVVPVVVVPGSVVVPVVVVPVPPEAELLEHGSEPLASGDCVVGVPPELVVWAEPLVGQVVTCVAEPAAAPSAPLAAPAVEVSVVLELSLEPARMCLVACVLATVWAAVAWCVAAGAAALTVWEELTVCDWTGATCELKLILRVWITVTCELKPEVAWTTRACAGVACATAQCEPPRPSAPATPKTAAPAALISATEHSHLLRSMILSRHRVIAVPDSIPVPRLRALNHSVLSGGYSPS